MQMDKMRIQFLLLSAQIWGLRLTGMRVLAVPDVSNMTRRAVTVTVTTAQARASTQPGCSEPQ